MTYASAHNGGKLQVGVNFMQGGQEFAYLNLLKTAQFWLYISNSNVPSPNELDSDGYPTTISNGGVYTVFFIPSQTERPGNYVVKWDGNGTIYGAGTPQGGGSLTSSGGSGRCVVSVGTDTRITVGISAIGSPRITNIRYCHVDDEATLDAGGMFGSVFKQRLIDLNPGIIRFLDRQLGNYTNVSQWAHRRQPSYVFYAESEQRPGIYAGVTSSSGDVYTVASPSTWSGLVDKATVTVKFNSSATTDSATLNVGATGAKAIRSQYGAVTSVDFNNRPVANVHATLVYDQDLDCWLKFGGGIDPGHFFLQNGEPYENMVRLCAEIGAHPYFVTPFLAADPLTDFVPSLATYVRDFAAAICPWMQYIQEGVNENWNSALGFPGTAYAWAKANHHWGVNFGHHNWTGKTVSVIGQAISTVFSGDRSKYKVMLGVQLAEGNLPSGSDARLTAAEYVAQAAAAQSPYLKDPAYKWATDVVTSMYFSPYNYREPQELRDAYAYNVTYAGDPTNQAVVATSYLDTVASPPGDYNLPGDNTRYQNWASWAAGPWGGSYSLGLRGYEGGFSADYLQGNWTSPITGATKASSCVLTLADTNTPYPPYPTGNGNPAVVGMSLTISGVGGMTQLNGNTYTVTAVSGNSVTINANSTGFSTFTSGGTVTYVNSGSYVNRLRYAAKFVPHFATHYQTNLDNFTDAGGVYPSQYLIAGTSASPLDQTAFGTGQVWPVLDPDVYGLETPAWDVLVAFSQSDTPAPPVVRFIVKR